MRSGAWGRVVLAAALVGCGADGGARSDGAAAPDLSSLGDLASFDGPAPSGDAGSGIACPGLTPGPTGPPPCMAARGLPLGHPVVACFIDGLGHAPWAMQAQTVWNFFQTFP